MPANAVGFGVAAAILTVGGLAVLRFQRNRHDFDLARAALERGITSLQTAQPPWRASLRHGVMTLTLGLSLVGVGGVWWLADKVDLPEGPAIQSSADLLSAPEPRDEQGRLKPEGRLYTMASSQWERSQTQRAVGLALAGSGVVLVLLGAARIAFSRVEKKYLVESAASDE